MKFFSQHNRSTQRISQRILYILLGFTVVVFALFYLVGYDFPFIENPDFNAPLLTDVLLIGIYAIVLLTIVIAAWAIKRENSMNSAASKIENNIPTVRIKRMVMAATAVVLLLTFALASVEPMLINGESFNNTIQLRLASQFIGSSIILLVAAIGAMVFGFTRYYRKNK